MEPVEDGDTLLVAGGQHWASNRYMDKLIGLNSREEVRVNLSIEDGFTDTRA